MNDFQSDALKLPGRHISSVFALLILKLTDESWESIEDKLLVKGLVDELKTLFHNHETSFRVLSFTIKQNLAEHGEISPKLRRFLVHVLDCLSNNNFQQQYTIDAIEPADLECRVQRVFESNFAVNLLSAPCDQMWESIAVVSERLIPYLESFKTQNIMPELFLSDLGPFKSNPDEPHLALAFGRFEHKPSIDDLIRTLKEGKDVIKIMIIHFMFMRDAYDFFNLEKGLGDFVASQAQGDFREFLRLGNKKDMREFFWGYTKIAPHLYTDRGRAKFDQKTSKRMGIAIHEADVALFPEFSTSWCPDALCQQANLGSPYVNYLIQHNIPYIAGPSGMTSLFMGILTFFGRFREAEEKNYYILAVLAFMVGGGLHSMHEVLTIPAVRMGLLEFYRVSGSKPGNFDDFFSLFRHNQRFQQSLNETWEKTLGWIREFDPALSNINLPEEKKGIMERACASCVIC